MAIQEIKNVEICGVAACVPSTIEENAALDLFKNREEYQKFVNGAGVERRRVALPGQCASDLCLEAAEQLIQELQWDKKEIGCLIFVSHSPDYKYPATACVLQGRLGLSSECMSFDISLGCSGWVYGLSVLGSLVSSGTVKKALLLAGDITTVTKSRNDRGTYPIFGDAGSATALQYKEGSPGFYAHMGTEGKKYQSLIAEDGGSRNRFSKESLIEKEYEPGVIRTRLQTKMDGMSVFSFGITKVPQSVNTLLDRFQIDKGSIDYFVFHQASLMMNRHIQKKLSLPDEKVPYSLKNFGNSSAGTIPVTLVTKLCEKINQTHEHPLQILTCGFGVGLSFGSLIFTMSDAVCCELIEL